MGSRRRATHAGSWYSDSSKELNCQLEKWLQDVNVSFGPARAIIAPHAGYQYSGKCAAYAYKQINPKLVKRIFILGPSHHVRLSGCVLTSVQKYLTPFYDLIIDQKVCSSLLQTGHFECMNISADENEHSIEMHLPYIAKVMEDFAKCFTIVPILVGALDVNNEKLYGHILAPYLDNSENLFVVSSDFCHWGSRFRYTFYNQSWGKIHESIQKLDELGMNAVESLSPKNFTEYLKKYCNTICGRHPIGILLQAICYLQRIKTGMDIQLKFLKYDQSNQCTTMSCSSVSYGAASLILNY